MTEAERIAEWTARAKSGGEDAAEAFESLYTVYRKRVYYFCHCLLEDEAAAVDATCSVFLYAWRNLRSMPAGQTFYPWICGNAFYFVKIALAGLRGTSVTVEEIEGDPSLFDELALAPEKVAPELSVRRSHLDTVTEQVTLLPIADRICVMLYDYARFSPEEVATMVGCSEETVRYRVYNGHEAIAAGLDARTPGDGEIFRPVLDKLIRTCGKNCTMPDQVTDRIRAGIAEGREVELPEREELPAEKQSGLSRLSPVTINRICILLGFLFAGALTYILYWIMSSPASPEAGSDPSYESSVVISGAVSDALSEAASDVSGDESEPESSAGEESGVESTSGTSSVDSSEPSSEASSAASSEETSSEPVLGELPRTTENLRMRTAPTTADPDNLVIMIPKGAHIDILETVTNDAGETWYFARYTVATGLWYEGYCSADYIQTEE